MKKYFIIFVFITAQKFLFAQYYPLPDSNVVWVRLDDIGMPSNPSPYTKFFTSIQKDDTTIISMKYVKLFYDYNLQSGIKYFGAYRSDMTGKTFFIPKDSTKELVLFDFSRNTGDTIKQLLVNGGGLADYIVDSVGTVNAGPHSLKTLSLHMIGPPPISCFYEYLTWIEKIGSIGSGVVNIGCRGCTLAFQLSCMQFNDTVYYMDNGGCSGNWWSHQSVKYMQGQCSFPLGIDNRQTVIDIQITPNPFSNQITLSNLPMDRKTNIQIADILGQRVFKTEADGKSSATFSFSEMGNGLYFISLQTSWGILMHKKIVKQ